jgi:hypothetical protein
MTRAKNVEKMLAENARLQVAAQRADEVKKGTIVASWYEKDAQVGSMLTQGCVGVLVSQVAHAASTACSMLYTAGRRTGVPSQRLT